jgi:hypothetical protein
MVPVREFSLRPIEYILVIRDMQLGIVPESKFLSRWNDPTRSKSQYESGIV